MNQNQKHWGLFSLISGIYVKSRRIAEEQLKPLDVTWPQFGALIILVQEDNITQTQLADRIEADTNTAMVLCNSMERKGWVNRNRNPSDKRSNLISLTPQGRAVFLQAYPLILQDYNLFVESISEEDIITISPILSALHEKIKNRYQEIKQWPPRQP